MSIFSWLLIGHLIGDWLLQNDHMARYKHNGIFSQQCIFHCAIYSGTILAILWLAAKTVPFPPPYLLFFLFTFFSHWVIDAFGLAARWGRWLRQTDAPFVRIVVDQTLHLITLALLIETLLS